VSLTLFKKKREQADQAKKSTRRERRKKREEKKQKKKKIERNKKKFRIIPNDDFSLETPCQNTKIQKTKKRQKKK
jgi:hypothetical protein